MMTNCDLRGQLGMSALGRGQLRPACAPARLPCSPAAAYSRRRSDVGDAGSGPDADPSLMFEQSRWRWPAMPDRPTPAAPGAPRRPPPPPPPPPAGRPRSMSGPGGPQARPRPRPRPPPPPPPPPPFMPGGGPAPGPPPPNWAEPLLRSDPELRELLTSNPELWPELQRRAGQIPGANGSYVPTPSPPDENTDPALYERQLQQWLRYKRSQNSKGGSAGQRADDEVTSLALLFLAAVLPLIAFGLAAPW
ncbi:hypothetical protein HYH03_004028 [Edaphochlamys debaryana]|uniref:Uncharacterized protein n=1 Tax=Edaphochlamys debaryana TaxID=47281 RepID=A0A836C287_9CHLO|nr:hypothetical protein HYH03_004028 [Edaphochlamys debaryana]|eukprot:KAG2497756.1 hypothetical protein HYH03_004028 [Edaphochlamys debaryana]